MTVPVAGVKEVQGVVSPVWQFPPAAASALPPSVPLLWAPPSALPLALPLLVLAVPLVLALPLLMLAIPLVLPVPPPPAVSPLPVTPLEPVLAVALPLDALGPLFEVPEDATSVPEPPVPGEELLQPACKTMTPRLIAQAVNFDLDLAIVEKRIGALIPCGQQGML